MYQKLKAEMKEIIDIVKQCPESLQEKCFELLLENYLTANNRDNGSQITKAESITEKRDANEENLGAVTERSEESPSEEIAIKDFHVKIQRFLKTNGITIEQINYLYYKCDGKILPLYDSLNSTSMSECQIRLALLSSFENSYSDGNGDFWFNVEEVRSRCNTMKCYSSANFMAYFKNNLSLWDNWPEKYDRGINIILSSEGKKELAKVLLDLAKGE